MINKEIYDDKKCKVDIDEKEDIENVVYISVRGRINNKNKFEDNVEYYNENDNESKSVNMINIKYRV